MNHLIWYLNALAGLVAVAYVYFVYCFESASFLFIHAFAIGAFCSCSLTLLWHYSRYFSAPTVRNFVSAFVHFVLLIAGVMVSTMGFSGSEINFQALLHCSTISTLGISLLAVKINTDYPQQKGEIMTLVLLSIATVIPFIVIIVAIAAFLTCRSSRGQIIFSPRFLVKPDALAGLVCNVFFTMSILHGFFISTSFIFNNELPYGIPIPAYYSLFHIAAFAVALGLLFAVRRITHPALFFYLAAAPAAIFPGYVLLPLAYIIVMEHRTQPAQEAKLAP